MYELHKQKCRRQGRKREVNYLNATKIDLLIFSADNCLEIEKLPFELNVMCRHKSIPWHWRFDSHLGRRCIYFVLIYGFVLGRSVLLFFFWRFIFSNHLLQLRILICF